MIDGQTQPIQQARLLYYICPAWHTIVFVPCRAAQPAGQPVGRVPRPTYTSSRPCLGCVCLYMRPSGRRLQVGPVPRHTPPPPLCQACVCKDKGEGEGCVGWALRAGRAGGQAGGQAALPAVGSEREERRVLPMLLLASPPHRDHIKTRTR